MRDGICPKCKGAEVRVVANTAAEIAMGLGWTASAFMNYQVCSDYGFVELFIQDHELFPKLAAKCPKVG